MWVCLTLDNVGYDFRVRIYNKNVFQGIVALDTEPQHFFAQAGRLCVLVTPLLLWWSTLATEGKLWRSLE